MLASDGIWDVLSNDDVVKLVLRKISQGILPEQICEELMTECLSPDLLMTGTDNMTVVLICFLHKKTYDDLCKHAKDLVKDDEQHNQSDELNDKDADFYRKIGRNVYRNVDLDNDVALEVDVTTAEIGKVTNNIDEQANGTDGNVIDSASSSDSQIPNNDKANKNNTEINEKDDNAEKTDNIDSEPKIVQESKKFKETNSESDLQ